MDGNGVRRSRETIDMAMALDREPRLRTLLYVFSYLAGLVALQILHLAVDNLRLNMFLSLTLTLAFLTSYYLQPGLRTAATYIVSFASFGISIYYFREIAMDHDSLGAVLGILGGLLMVLLSFKAFTPGDHRFIMMFSVVFLIFSSVASYDLKFMLLLPVFLGFAGSALYISNQIDVAVRVEGTTGTRYSPRSRNRFSFVGILLRAVFGIIAASVVAYILIPQSGGSGQTVALSPAPAVDDPDQDRQDSNQDENGNENDDDSSTGLGGDFDVTSGGGLSDDPTPAVKLQKVTGNSFYLRYKVNDVYTGSKWVQSEFMEGTGANDNPIYLSADTTASSTYTYDAYQVPLLDFPAPDSFRSKRDEKLLDINGEQISQRSTEPYMGIAGSQGFINEGELEFTKQRYEITLLEPTSEAVFFTIFEPYSVENISPGIDRQQPYDLPALTMGSTLVSAIGKTAHPRNFTYTVKSLVRKHNERELELALGEPPAHIKRWYTQLPEYPLASEDSPVVDEDFIGPLEVSPGDGRPKLSRQMADVLNIEPEDYRLITDRLRNAARTFEKDPKDPEGEYTDWQKVRAILEYFNDPKRNFTYTRNATAIAGDQEATEAFFLDIQEGWCQRYASAMAVLCRLNGIPARVIEGYSPGEWSIAENAVIYRNSNAHAWVEVYITGHGWVEVDPTPNSRDWSNQPEATKWFGNMIDFLQDMFIIDPARTQELIKESLAKLWAWIMQHWLGSLAVLLGLAMLFGLHWMWQRGYFRRPPRPIVPENSVVEAFLRVSSLLDRLGVHRESGMTPRGQLMQASGRYGALATPLAGLIPVYERAAYSPQGMQEGDMDVANAAVQAVEDFVREELARRRQR